MANTKFDPIPSWGEDTPTSSTSESVPSVFDQFAEVDEKAEEEGVWTSAIGQGMKLKIRSFTSRAVMENYNRLMSAAQKKADANGDVPPEIAKDMASRVVAQSMVADWKGPAFVDPDGKPIEYSPEAVYHLAKKSKNFRLAVYSFSMAEEGYKKSVEEDAVKNS